MCNRPTPSLADDLTADPQTDGDDHGDSLSPAPLDCSDLAETFRTHTAAAFRLLMNLTSTQLNLQALTYAAYLNQLHGLNLDMDNILTGWQSGLERARHTAHDDLAIKTHTGRAS